MAEDKRLSDDVMSVTRSELILGGQKSGKSRRAEALARHWLAESADHRAVLLATATASDAEMSARIVRHQHDRARNSPGLQCLEVPLALPEAIGRHSAVDTLVVVDCPTLWLTNSLWPRPDAAGVGPRPDILADVALGVLPMGPAVRAFVDALGQLNQAVAQACDRVTFMVAGLPLRIKGY